MSLLKINKNIDIQSISSEELRQIVVPRRLKSQVDRRIECARMLLDGRSYNDIIADLRCSTAFVSAVAKRLKAAGFIR